MSISITRTPFDSNYHYSQIAGSNNIEYYVYHNVDAFNVIAINGVEFNATYQNGCSVIGGDYSCPSNNPELSPGGGADELLCDIWNQGDFDDSDQADVSDLLDEFKEEHDLELTLEDLREVYAALALNQQDAEREIQSLDLSDNLDDYIENECTGFLERKKGPAEIDVVIAGASVDSLPEPICVRFIDAIKARLSLEYPKSEVVVEFNEGATEGHIYVDGDASGDDAENVSQIISLIWEKEEY